MSLFGQNGNRRRVLGELCTNNTSFSVPTRTETDSHTIDLAQMKFLLQLIEIHLEINQHSQIGGSVPLPYQIRECCELYQCSVGELKVALQLQIFKIEQSHLLQDESTKAISRRLFSPISSSPISLSPASVSRTEKLPSSPKDTSFCTFCKTNKETKQWYTGHKLKTEDGRVQCPILRNYTCQICGATGDFAHTLKYCPTLKRH